MKKLIAAALILAAVPAYAGTVIGSADIHVRDADTIVLRNMPGIVDVPVRLQGVDAPEDETKAGRDATRWMKEYLRGKSVECHLNGETNRDRYIGVCFVGGQDIGAAVIAAGKALDCARFSGGRYRQFETLKARAGIKRARYC